MAVSTNRWTALIFYVVGGLILWYATLLMSEKSVGGLPKPTRTQLWGAVVAGGLSLAMWSQDVFTMIPTGGGGSSPTGKNVLFTKNKVTGLVLLWVAAAISWYVTVLMTEISKEYPKPKKMQMNGLYIAVAISLFTWLQEGFTYKGTTK